MSFQLALGLDEQEEGICSELSVATEPARIALISEKIQRQKREEEGPTGGTGGHRPAGQVCSGWRLTAEGAVGGLVTCGQLG